MSIVKFGAVVVAARGTVSGVTFSQNKSGPYARGWSRGANACRPFQSEVRSALSTTAALWRTLDAALQADWDAWAADPAQARVNALGETYYLSGFQAYVSINRCLGVVGRANDSAVPTLAQPAAPSGLGATLSAGAVADVVTYGAGEFGPTYDMVVEVSLASGEGSVVSPGGWKTVYGAQVPGGTSVTITTEMAERFGLQRLGQVGFLRVYRQTIEGYRSAAGSVRTVVVS